MRLDLELRSFAAGSSNGRSSSGSLRVSSLASFDEGRKTVDGQKKELATKSHRKRRPVSDSKKVVTPLAPTPVTCDNGRGHHAACGVGAGESLAVGGTLRTPLPSRRRCFLRPSAAVLSLIVVAAAVVTPGASSKPSLYATAEEHGQRQPVRIELKLRPVRWPADSMERGSLAASVGLEALLVEEQGHESNQGHRGGLNSLSAGYRILADFDAGSVRLWQGPRGHLDRQPLVPLGLCPGEHSVSAWGLEPSSSSVSNSGNSFVSSAAPEFFTTHAAKSTKGADAAAGAKPPPPALDTRGESNSVNTKGGGVGVVSAVGKVGDRCDESERQPSLPGREGASTNKGESGLCRVCSYTVSGESLSGGDNDAGGVSAYYLTSPMSPLERKRLVLRTSLTATFSKGGRTASGVTGAQSDQYHDEHQAAGKQGKEQAFEWPIELREGDSPASVARFVTSRLGLDITPRGTTPEARPRPAASSTFTSSGLQKEELKLAPQDVEREAVAALTEGERVALWVTQKLETEIAERQVRRSSKRAEAVETASRTGNLRIVLGASAEAEGDDHDSHHSPDSGWLTTDVNVLDVTDPADFEYLLGPAGLVDAFLAEHVWEHLSLQDAHRATRNCRRHLRPGGRLRLAVPDPAWYSAASEGLSVSRSGSGSTNGGAGAILDKPLNHAAAPDFEVDTTPIGSGNDGSTTAAGDRQIVHEEEVPCESDNGRDTANHKGAATLLPEWLSQNMLAADARDGHLVQYTPELLANVCWSSGLMPVLVEGGDGDGESGLRSSKSQPTPTTSMATGARVTEDMRGPLGDVFPAAAVKVAGDSAGYSDTPKDRRSAQQEVVGPSSAYSPVAGRRGPAGKEEQSYEWGRVKRSIAGGDPRGAVSIVMDCIKPSGKKEDERDLGHFFDRPETPEQRETSGSGQASHPTHTDSYQDLDSSVPPKQHLHPLYSRLSSVDHVPNLTKSVEDEAIGMCFAGTAVDTASGVTYGDSASDGPDGDRELTGEERQDDQGDIDADGGGGGDGICDSLRPPVTPLRKRKASFKEWAAAARKSRRMDWPLQRPNVSVPRQELRKTFSRENIPSTFRAPKSARTRAHQALLAGNVTKTVELCHDILQEWPSDAATHLYLGAAMAQSGEWDIAWDKMEYILALSSGVQEPATASSAAASEPQFVDNASSMRSNVSDPLFNRTKASPTDGVVPLDIFLAASANLASFARARASGTMDPLAEVFFLVEGLRGAADRDRVAEARIERAAATPPTSAQSPSSGKRNGALSSEATSSQKRAQGRNGDASCAGGNNEVGPVDGFIDHLITMGQALEGKGQLTSALRLYQRAILLGGHQDQRALRGLAGLSRSLLEAKRRGTPSRSTTRAEEDLTLRTPRTTAPSRVPPDHHQQNNRRQTGTDTRSSVYSSSSFSGGMPVSTADQPHTQRKRKREGCDWTIKHPRPGQTFSPEDPIQVEFDLALLDPGLPSAGSLFKTVAIGGRRDNADSLLSEVYQDGGASRTDVDEDGLGFVVCSFIDSFKAAHCLPRGQLRDIGLGWHQLTAEVYQLPSLRAFSCPRGGGAAGKDTGRHSTRTVRFCVGDVATSCRPVEGESESNTFKADIATIGSPSTRIPPRNDHPHDPYEGGFAGVPENDRASAKQKISSSEAPRLRTGVGEENWTETTAAVTDHKGTELPFCFMTLALNAMPFITHHAPTFEEAGRILAKRAAAASATTPTNTAAAPNRNNSSETPTNPDTENAENVIHGRPLPPPPPESFWEWHIVEGVAAGRANHDNPYSQRRIPDRFFDPVTGLSVDGTSEYLDRLVADSGGVSSPQQEAQIHVHRRCGSRRSPTGIKRGAGNYGSDSTTDKFPGVSVRDAAERTMRFHGGRGEVVEPVGGVGVDVDGGARSSCLWRDKIQMINTVAFSLEKECLLVQVDADELWTAEQLVRLRDMFLLERKGNGSNSVNTSREGDKDEGKKNRERQPTTTETGEDPGLKQEHARDDGESQSQRIPAQQQPQQEHQHQQLHRHNRTPKSRQCAYFHCHFFVGPDLVTVTEDGWGHSSSNEWLRAWIFQPSESVWLQHAPPELARHDEAAGWMLLAGDKCIGREETEKAGLVFTHYAYVLEEQVRFKDAFYGHSEAARTDQSTAATATTADTVEEWRALQRITPPVLLTDHLTWLRVQGISVDPRLLTTVADRPPLSPSSSAGRHRNRPDDRRAREENEKGGYFPTDHRGGGKAGEVSVPEGWETTGFGGRGGGGGRSSGGGREEGVNEGDSAATSCAGNDALSSSAELPVASIVPLEPFLQLAEEGREESSTTYVEGGTRGRSQMEHPAQGRSCLTHDVHTGMKEYGFGAKRRRKTEDEVGRGDKCGSLHLVVDGVVFQVDAAKPAGISRVWANILPAMLDRLSEFEGTCLTLLVRGLAPPALDIQKAFSRLPPERFAVTHIPLYNPSFGHVADGLMLSWAVRNAGATAFVSTLYTQPLHATTPNVRRVLLVHDVLPEVFGWDMSKGEWLQKARAVAGASAVVAVSQHTAKNFLRVYPSPFALSSASGGDPDLGSRNISPAAAAWATPRSVWVAHNGVDTTVFRPRTAANNSLHNGDQVVNTFRRLAGLDRAIPYVMIVGSRRGYKNARAAFHALGLATTPTGTSSARPFTTPGSLALVLIGGGPIVPEELELLAEIGVWSHVGAGSGVSGGDRGETDALDDGLLAEGYSGAVALLHLSIGEGFGLTVLEAFACGCPVIAADIPPVREIAGLPDLEHQKEATEASGAKPASTGSAIGKASAVPSGGESLSAASTLATAAANTEIDDEPTATDNAARSDGGDTASSGARDGGRYDGASFPLDGGLVLIENPTSATQIWRAVRALAAMKLDRRVAASEALVRRAKAFDSWQPLADTLIKAVVED